MLPKITIREKEICHITIDQVICNELEETASDNYIGVLKMATNINVGMQTEGSLIIDCAYDSINDILPDLKHFGFKVAVLWAEGSWPTDQDIDNEILQSIKEWNKFNWGCAGHILDRPGKQHPEFHHQCVIINLETITDIRKSDVYEYEASTEHLHDDYTPMWIKPLNDPNRINPKPAKTFFDRVLRTSLEMGLTVFNLDYNIRGNKVCVYPEDDIKWAENELFKKYTLSDLYDSPEQYMDKRPLLEFKVQQNAIVYITNTEMVPHTTINNLQVAVCPCSGLHQFKYIEPSLDVMETVIWADYSTYAVEWMQILIHEWNGKDFHKFFEANKDRLKFDGHFMMGYGTWEKFLDSFESEEQWLIVWGKIQNLEHQFKVVNIVEDHDKVVELIPHNKNVLLQCSNIFLYESNYFTPGISTTLNAIDYVTKVQSISNKVIFNGDINRNYYDMTNMGRQKWI